MIQYHWRVTYWEGNTYKGVISTLKFDTWDDANRVACRYNLRYCYRNGHCTVSAS
jgi:hypothetical protein